MHNWREFLRLLIQISVLVTWSSAASSSSIKLESPCPNVFVYQGFDLKRGVWYGTLLLTTEKQSSVVTSVRILFDSVATSLRLQDNLSPEVVIDTLDNTEYLIDGLSLTLRAGVTQPLTFIVSFPPGGPVSRFTAIRVNDVTVCSITFSLGPGGHYITTVAPVTISSTKFQESGNDVSGGSPPPWTSEPRPQGPHPFGNQPVEPTSVGEGCGRRVTPVAPLIVNGKSSQRGQWPWHGALYTSDVRGLKYQCGASLISRIHVLTAAHCVTKHLRSEEPLPPHVLLLVFGRTLLSSWQVSGKQEIPAVHITVHPQYKSNNLHNDLSIVRLSRAVDTTPLVRPVCLWPENMDPSIEKLVDRTGTIVGWGYTADGTISDGLQHAQIPVVSPLTCVYSDTSFYSQYSSPKSYCAGIPGNTSACNGDSGGGMVFRLNIADVWYIRGIVSLAAYDRNTEICDVNHYVVFTDVALYMSWIRQQLNDF